MLLTSVMHSAPQRRPTPERALGARRHGWHQPRSALRGADYASRAALEAAHAGDGQRCRRPSARVKRSAVRVLRAAITP